MSSNSSSNHSYKQQAEVSKFVVRTHTQAAKLIIMHRPQSYILQSAIALCVAAQCVAASYNNNHNNGYQQRKLAPTPQQYSAPAPTYGGHEQQAQQYEQAAPQYEAAAPAYRAPSSAAVSQYDERTPAASYNKPAPAAYAPARQAAYAAPAAYAKPAPKYEEPYVSIHTHMRRDYEPRLRLTAHTLDRQTTA